VLYEGGRPTPASFPLFEIVSSRIGDEPYSKGDKGEVLVTYFNVGYTRAHVPRRTFVKMGEPIRGTTQNQTSRLSIIIAI
jgi:hypothetical protein